MTVDWDLAITIGVPVGMLFLGGWVTRWFENRPVLISYYGHISAFKVSVPDGSKVDVYTHSVVLRNAGRKSATNVRLSHLSLPDFVIYPPVVHEVTAVPDGGKDILIPTLVPNEQITVSYLYGPPLTYAGNNAGIKSDAGLARQIPVLLQRQYPTWVNLASAGLVMLGVATTLYLVAKAAMRMLR